MSSCAARTIYWPPMSARQHWHQVICSSVGPVRPRNCHMVTIVVAFLGRLFDRVDLIKPVPNIRPYVRPSTKSFFDFSEIWHVGRCRWVMHDGIQYDQGQGHEPLKVGNPSIFKSYLIRQFQWELATDHWFVNSGTISKFDWAGYLIFVLFCVTRLWTWQKRLLWGVDRQSRTGLIYLWCFQLTFAHTSTHCALSVCNYSFVFIVRHAASAVYMT